MTRIFTLALGILLLMPLPGRAHHDQLVAGAGPSTKVAELFFQHFSKNPVCKEYTFEVMPTSVKHKGGIMSSDKFLFGRTGRPLNAKEKALGKEEIFLGKVPVTFAVGLKSEADNIDLQQLKAIFTGKITNWKEIGGADVPIQLVGRENTEALFLELKKHFPYFKQVKFHKIFKKDHEVVKYLSSAAGSNAIAFGAKPNFSEYFQLPVEGFKLGVPLGLVYDLKNTDDPVIKAAIKYANSQEWKSKLGSLDMLPVD